MDATATLFLEATEQGSITLRTMDTSGRLVHESRVVTTVGTNRLDFPVAALEPGPYFLHVVDIQGTVLGRTSFIRQ